MVDPEHRTYDDSDVENNISQLNTSINLTLEETSIDVSDLLSKSIEENDPESSFLIQQDLYGLIKPAPMKHECKTPELPKLSDKLIIPKQRERSNSMETQTTFLKNKINNTQKLKPPKRPSTCGKEGMRHFSTPLPLKLKTLEDTNIPILSPDNNDYDDNIINSADVTLQTPFMDKTKITSPLSVRSFSTPLADLRAKNNKKTAVQIKLNQLSSDEYLEELERQLQREILKYQSDINLMTKIKKYRQEKDSQNLVSLIDKWRDIAERASNYMFNQARSKISRMGGMEEYRKKQKNAKLRKMKFEFDEGLLFKIEEYMESEEYKNLDRYEQDEIKSRKKEMEKMSEKIENGEIPFADDNNNNEDDDEDDEFSMKELYKQLGLDYNLVFGISSLQ